MAGKSGTRDGAEKYGLHDHGHEDGLPGLKGKLDDLIEEFDLEDLLEGYEQFKSLIPVGEGLWKLGRKDVSKVLSLLVGAVLDLSDDLQPQLVRGHKLDALRRKSYLDELVSAGFERHEAMQILLAQIKPLNMAMSESFKKGVSKSVNKMQKK